MAGDHNFYEVVRGRRSIRKFLPDPVPREDLEEIISVAAQAPSANNQQMYLFVAVANRDLLQRMGQAVVDALDRLAGRSDTSQHRTGLNATKGWSTFFTKAPVTVAVFGKGYSSATDKALGAAGYSDAERDRLRGKPDIQSVGAVIQTLLLAAHAKGYGTCWMCAPVIAAPELEQLLGVSEEWQLKALIPLGRPAESPSQRPKKALEEIFTYLP